MQRPSRSRLPVSTRPAPITHGCDHSLAFHQVAHNLTVLEIVFAPLGRVERRNVDHLDTVEAAAIERRNVWIGRRLRAAPYPSRDEHDCQATHGRTLRRKACPVNAEPSRARVTGGGLWIAEMTRPHDRRWRRLFALLQFPRARVAYCPPYRIGVYSFRCERFRADGAHRLQPSRRRPDGSARWANPKDQSCGSLSRV